MTPDEFRAFRARVGLSQGKLGRLLGIPQPTISRWETGALKIERDILLERALRDLERELVATSSEPARTRT